MSARRIARELAIIVMPQLPKNTEKLNEVEIMQLSDKAIHMLVDYARQNLMDAQALVVTASNELTDIEVEHESNKNLVEDLKAVPLNSGQIKEKLRTLETAISLVSEALDIPVITTEVSGVFSTVDSVPPFNVLIIPTPQCK